MASTLRVEKYRDIQAVAPTLPLKNLLFLPGRATYAPPLFTLEFDRSMLSLSHVFRFRL